MDTYQDMLDRFYEEKPEETKKEERLEIPKPQTHIQGGETIIKNFKRISEALRRDPKHLLKYLSKELATAGNLQRSQATLKGRFRNYQVKEKLERYIKEYVTCQECGKADTKFMKVRGIQHKRCEACGARTSVKEL